MMKRSLILILGVLFIFLFDPGLISAQNRIPKDYVEPTRPSCRNEVTGEPENNSGSFKRPQCGGTINGKNYPNTSEISITVSWKCRDGNYTETYQFSAETKNSSACSGTGERRRSDCDISEAENCKKQGLKCVIRGADTAVCSGYLDSTSGGGTLENFFGRVTPPQAIEDYGTGAAGISRFLNNVISLIYIISLIAFLFMLLWGAIGFIISGGDKEAVGAARKRIYYAFVGLILLAVAFAIFNVLGTFTGFTFFSV